MSGVYIELEALGDKVTGWIWSEPKGERGPGSCVCLFTFDGVEIRDGVLTHKDTAVKKVNPLPVDLVEPDPIRAVDPEYDRVEEAEHLERLDVDGGPE